MTRIENSPAFLIHRRMYQGSSLLLDFFTKSHGRVRLIARGARSSKMSLQMFQCLSISFKGKSDLKSLSQWEILDEPRRLLGDDLILAIYANELLIRLLPEGDEYSELFNAYWLYIKNIKNKSNPEKEYSLRIFENQLLLELGYGLDFKDDIEGTPIKGSVLYDFIEDQGFIAQTEGKILGEILLNIVSPNQVIPNSKG
jgi:DNA repair protein RecO (recombination protein O)